MSRKEWINAIAGVALVSTPDLFCFLIPKNFAEKYEKELVLLGMGTITAILFVHLIPDLMLDVAENPKYWKRNEHYTKIFGALIFAGLFISYLLHIIDAKVDEITTPSRNKTPRNNDNNTTKGGSDDSTKKRRNIFKKIPHEAKIMICGLIVHNFADGILIGDCGLVVAYALFGHEIAHVSRIYFIYIVYLYIVINTD